MSQNLDPNLERSDSRENVHRAGPAAPSSSGSSGSSSRSAPFYSPPPGSQEAPTAVAAGSQYFAVGLAVLVAIVLGAAAWYGASTRSASVPTSATAAATSPTDQKTFLVAKANADPQATELLKSLLASGTAASGATSALRAGNGVALVALGQSSPQFASDLKSGRRVLYRVHLLDFLAEDGDHAELSVDGLSLGDVYLKNAGTEFLIPLTPGIPAQMKLLATADGGGGVTVCFVSSLGEARTRILQVGQFEQWQVAVQ